MINRVNFAALLISVSSLALVGQAASAEQRCTKRTVKQSVATDALCGCTVVTAGMLRYIQRRPDFDEILLRTSVECPAFAAVLTDLPTASFAADEPESPDDEESRRVSGSSVSGSSGPGDEGPVDEGPVDEGPVDEGPVDEGPVDEGPVDEGPVDEGPGNSGGGGVNSNNGGGNGAEGSSPGQGSGANDDEI